MHTGRHVIIIPIVARTECTPPPRASLLPLGSGLGLLRRSCRCRNVHGCSEVHCGRRLSASTELLESSCSLLHCLLSSIRLQHCMPRHRWACDLSMKYTSLSNVTAVGGTITPLRQMFGYFDREHHNVATLAHPCCSDPPVCLVLAISTGLCTSLNE